MLSGHPDIAKLCGNSHSEHSWTKNIHYNGRYNSPWFISHSIAYTSLLFIDVLDYQIENEQQTRLMPPPWESITNVNAILIILIDALNLPLECEAPRKKTETIHLSPAHPFRIAQNTFHFAGVGAKNVTLGVPRLKEPSFVVVVVVVLHELWGKSGFHLKVLVLWCFLVISYKKTVQTQHQALLPVWNSADTSSTNTKYIQ